MLFNSLDFFIFLPIVLGLYFVLPLTGRHYLLLAASLFFYMYWSVPYIGLLLLSTLVDYSVARRLEVETRARARKALLGLSLACNLGLLAFFKYYNFFLDALGDVGFKPDFLPYSHLLLPLGISFYTFQTMSYTIDVYRGQLRAERSLPKMMLYVSFFPQLVAGPIVRASDLLPQLGTLQRFDWDDLFEGSRRVLNGFVKKVVVADNLAPIVAQVYGAPDEYSSFALLIATYAFALQIFCDFSGYSDIAIGLARMMGYRFMENFDVPYIARSIQEFWRRWHISLSTWLRDYLYISLGGNRKGPWKTYRNLLITMLLGGLWHGASFNFIIWGGIHGTWLAAERLWCSRRPAEPRGDHWLRATLKTLAVFHGVCIAWVFFRAQTLPEALTVLGRIGSGAAGVELPFYESARALFIACLGAVYFWISSHPPKRRLHLEWVPSMAGAYLVVLFGAASHEFLYFVF